jgi:hypothetical protein
MLLLQLQLAQFCGVRSVGPAAGGTFGAAFKETLNRAFSKDPFLSFETAAHIGLQAGIGAITGGLAQWYDPQTAKESITLALISFDRQVCEHDIVELIKFWTGW